MSELTDNLPIYKQVKLKHEVLTSMLALEVLFSCFARRSTECRDSHIVANASPHDGPYLSVAHGCEMTQTQTDRWERPKSSDDRLQPFNLLRVL